MNATAALSFLPVPGPVAGGRGGIALGDIAASLREVCAAAVDDAGVLGFAEAAAFAGDVEEIARAVEFLQVVAAGAVDRTRTQAAISAASKRGGAGLTAEDEAGGPGAALKSTVAGPVGDGYRRTTDFLRDRLRISAAEAHRRLCLAGELLPRVGLTGQPIPAVHEELAAAFADGEVPSRSATIITQALDRVRLLSDPATVARMEEALTTVAAVHDPDFLTRVARRWIDGLDQDGTEPTEELLRQLQGAFIRRPRHGLQHLEIFATTDQFEHLLTVMNTATNPRTAATVPGAVDASGTTPAAADKAPAQGCAVSAEKAFAAESGVSEERLDLRTRPQRLLDGLIGACKAALATGGLPATGGLRPQVMVTIDYRDLLTRLTTDSGIGDQTAGEGVTASGTLGLAATGTLAFTGPVTAATIRKIACDADIIPVLLGTDGRILDIGRTSRIFPPHIRKAITARDKGCTFPGCTIPAPWCEAHHIDYWSRGGPTSTDNGVLLCSHHHHLIHKEQWTIQTRNGTPWYTPPPHLDPHQKPRQNHYFT
ncbi:DUF222 domain-containing protein [Arthrobacter sp. YD4]|uniref:HNH endonuclease signature motif containing protein n=1 Tax=Arthrobacter sp. YD4 TaxID=3058043 RepID=UPI0025B3BB84|nr:HNH endonuclease signature motif containing protein [Arthrobacter sp. YD4]MDN3936088.1 DUF222 domain-containing protein [Arthrobacter sp. YD4]